MFITGSHIAVSLNVTDRIGRKLPRYTGAKVGVGRGFFRLLVFILDRVLVASWVRRGCT